MIDAENTTIPVGAPIRSRLAGARRALVGLEFGRRLLITLAIAIAICTAILISDALFELPLDARRLALWVGLLATPLRRWSDRCA